jgi:hypothetical protein
MYQLVLEIGTFGACAHVHVDRPRAQLCTEQWLWPYGHLLCCVLVFAVSEGVSNG